MADISLVIDVQQKGVVKAVKDTKALEKNAMLLSKAWKAGDLSQRQYYKGLSQLAKATKTSEKDLRDYASTMRRVEAANKSETAATKAYAKARRDANAINARFNAEQKKSSKILKDAARENRRLRMEYKQGYAAKVKLRLEQMRLSSAMRKGIIDAASYKDAMQRLTVSQDASTVASSRTRRAMGHSSVITQQAGYQIGDFLVQVQSGTNAMVAFGQQATQVAGTLTILGGKWVMIGTALGITIPLFTAFAAYLMRTAGAQKEVADGADEMMSAFNSIKSKQDELSDSVERYGDALLVAKTMANSDNATLLSNLSAELSARKELLAVEKERFELRRFELQEEIKQRKEVIDGLFTMSEVQRQTALATATSEAERMAINKTYLEDTRRIIEGNRELFLNQREQEATLDLIDALLKSNTDNMGNAASAAEKFAAALKDAKLAGESLANLQFEFSAGGQAMALYGGRGTTSDRPISGDLPEGYGEEPTISRSGGSGSASTISTAAADSLNTYKAALKEVMALEAERTALVEPMARAFTDGFTSMVDGTMKVKDAFKAMALDIVKQLWKIFVVEQMVNSITGSFGLGGSTGMTMTPKANPLSGLSGSQLLPSFAGGGYTGDGSRSGGMDGQGGYLAMLHPRETVVDHTKGQATGGDTINISQSFNFSANGDESVKKIIAQAAPQIAQMTQKSMMDQRRRGGAMKSTFG